MMHAILIPPNPHAEFILHDCRFWPVPSYHHSLGLYRSLMTLPKKKDMSASLSSILVFIATKYLTFTSMNGSNFGNGFSVSASSIVQSSIGVVLCFLVGLEEVSCGFYLLGPKCSLHSTGGRLRRRFVASLLLLDAPLMELSIYSVVILSLLICLFVTVFPSGQKGRRAASVLSAIGK